MLNRSGSVSTTGSTVVRPRLAVASAVVALAVAGVVVAVATAGPASASRLRYRLGTAPTTTVAPTTTTVAPFSGRACPVLFGATTDNSSSSLPGLTAFSTDAGKRVSLYLYYASFAFDANFDTTLASAVQARGAVPMVTWEPWDPTSGSANQPAYALSKISAGSYDAYITRWANQIKSWGQPVWLRFAHEMNGNWYPWAEGVNGNAPGSYVAAWRHVRGIFTKAGVTNVTWVWSPNVVTGTTPSLSSLYPGDAYVDWLGVDGYNWGTTQSWSSWQTPDEVFAPTLSAFAQISTRPIVIAETASAEAGGNKAQWIQQLFSMLAAQPRIKAFVWFNYNKETDWRIESSAAARSAFATAVSDSCYPSV